VLEVDNASEFLDIEGGTSDQASVDLGHGHELVDTFGCDGSTVLDTGGLGDLFVVHAGQDGTQETVRLVCCWCSVVWCTKGGEVGSFENSNEIEKK
jgi:hypothetical protein